MYRPTIHSNLWLGLMTIVFLGLYYWSEINKVTVPTDHYDAKLEASKIVADAMEILKNERLPQFDQNSKTSSFTDPLIFTMLGEKDSPITTDEGKIEDKITALNPNFAAAVVDMLIKSGNQEGDTVAVLLTGSIPGANLAVYAALRALKLHPVIITSVGSSWWGANSPDFTWLDMERILKEKGVFDFRSVAASIGGSDDQGGIRLTISGREMIIDAIDRNEVTFIHEGSLSENINARLELFKRVAPLGSYSSVINIGGGIASCGHRRNCELIPSGVNMQLPVKNYPSVGVIHYFSEHNVPVIMICDPVDIAEDRDYDLPVSQLPFPIVGKGLVFEQRKYNLSVAALVLSLMFIILVVVKFLDRKHYIWRERKIDINEID
ncbi:poly-gamma-glutamate system protein [bacterium]|nr:poly-gamma-glutamate system protein [bacterium]